MDRSVFISYSHNDRSAVRRDAELLRAGGVQIFIDVNDIGYGERWRDVLMQALAQCERVLVFWSRAAQVSEWVEREWRAALQLGKKIVPTLLDATPLPAELAEFQAIKRFRRVARPRPPQATAPMRPAPMAAEGEDEVPRTMIRPQGVPHRPPPSDAPAPSRSWLGRLWPFHRSSRPVASTAEALPETTTPRPPSAHAAAGSAPADEDDMPEGDFVAAVFAA